MHVSGNLDVSGRQTDRPKWRGRKNEKGERQMDIEDKQTDTDWLGERGSRKMKKEERDRHQFNGQRERRQKKDKGKRYIYIQREKNIYREKGIYIEKGEMEN